MADVTNSKLLDTGTGILKKDACIVLVKTEWNTAIVDELEKGCISELQKHHVKKIISITVPGAFEIPFGIKSYWENKGNLPAGRQGKKRPDAFIALGCIIRGDTPHFDYICKAVTEGVVQLNLSLPVPVIFGVLTVENEIQAKERIGGKQGHKGEEAAVACLKMIELNNKIRNKK
ncbi:MAG TPA: 6,7-dimethyl-8-ribityllumazine synthase [Chitinophagaceae bacterium]|nr:6,7-dimethyl-8-ribityllumazine synthase [Chitinophagaceae bacterium]